MYSIFSNRLQQFLTRYFVVRVVGSPQAPAWDTSIVCFSWQLRRLSLHALLYVLPSVPHVGSSYSEHTGHSHTALPSLDLQTAPKLHTYPLQGFVSSAKTSWGVKNACTRNELDKYEILNRKSSVLKNKKKRPRNNNALELKFDDVLAFWNTEISV